MDEIKRNTFASERTGWTEEKGRLTTQSKLKSAIPSGVNRLHLRRARQGFPDGGEPALTGSPGMLADSTRRQCQAQTGDAPRITSEAQQERMPVMANNVNSG